MKRIETFGRIQIRHDQYGAKHVLTFFMDGARIHRQRFLRESEAQAVFDQWSSKYGSLVDGDLAGEIG